MSNLGMVSRLFGYFQNIAPVHDLTSCDDTFREWVWAI
jgi:hypothetical protein